VPGLECPGHRIGPAARPAGNSLGTFFPPATPDPEPERDPWFPNGRARPPTPPGKSRFPPAAGLARRPGPDCPFHARPLGEKGRRTQSRAQPLPQLGSVERLRIRGGPVLYSYKTYIKDELLSDLGNSPHKPLTCSDAGTPYSLRLITWRVDQCVSSVRSREG